MGMIKNIKLTLQLNPYRLVQRLRDLKLDLEKLRRESRVLIDDKQVCFDRFSVILARLQDSGLWTPLKEVDWKIKRFWEKSVSKQG